MISMPASRQSLRIALKRYTSLLLFSSILFNGVAARGHASPEGIDLATINRIKDEELRHSQIMETLGYLADVFGPRLTGSPNIKTAQEWTRNKLTQWGLRD